MLVSLYKIKCINREDCHKEDSWLLSYAYPWVEQVAWCSLPTLSESSPPSRRPSPSSSKISFSYWSSSSTLFPSFSSLSSILHQQFSLSFILLQQLLRLRRRPLFSFFFSIIKFSAIFELFVMYFSALNPNDFKAYLQTTTAHRDHTNEGAQ